MTNEDKKDRLFGTIPQPKTWRRTKIHYNPRGNGLVYNKTNLHFVRSEGCNIDIVLRKNIKAVSLPRNMAVINFEFANWHNNSICIHGVVPGIPDGILDSIQNTIRKCLYRAGYESSEYYIQECRDSVYCIYSIFIRLGNQNFAKIVTSIVHDIKFSFGCIQGGNNLIRGHDHHDFTIETTELYRYRLNDDGPYYISFSDWFKIQQGYYTDPDQQIEDYWLMPQPDQFNEF